ncbi:MAG: hypothetical protein PUC59_05515, partial [Firmicutes bacterium]|nr:hypothetical protein [Bacillota bacterium]
MKQPVLRKAEKYARAHRRKKLWYRVVTCLAAAVVFCTVYALVLPAITMEKQCSIPEHTHSDDCYAQVTFVTKKVPVCSEESLELHRHTESCYDGEGQLICGYADFVVHHHDSSCYDGNGALWCPLPEIEPHTHTESCLQSAESGAEPACGKTEIVLHGHTAECFDENGTLICGKLQILAHQHTDSCFAAEEVPVDPTVLTCTETDPEHVHTPRCYGTWELTCGMEEHVHGEACQTAVETASDGEAERVEELIARIDALPSSEEIEEQLTALDDAGDEDGYLAYYEGIYHRVMEAYLLYLDVGSDGQQQVTNREKLLALEWMYSARTMAITGSVTVQQVNCFGRDFGGTDKVILIYNASGTAQTARSIVSNLYRFPSATAITVENRNGTLVVAETDTATEDKGTKSIPANGFMIIIPTGGSVSVSAGDYAAADFDYTKQAFNTGGLGT